MPQMFGIFASFIGAWRELKMTCIIDLNLYSAIWSVSDKRCWMIDRRVKTNWETATIMPITGCILPLPVPFLSASVSVYQKITIKQRAGEGWLMHIFVFPLLWFCHSEVHLSEEKLAALLGLATAVLGLAGDRLRPGVVPQAQSDCLSITTLALFGRIPVITCLLGFTGIPPKRRRH